LRVGKDVVVFTQKEGTRSLGFFSRTMNQKRENSVLEIPIITYDAKT